VAAESRAAEIRSGLLYELARAREQGEGAASQCGRLEETLRLVLPLATDTDMGGGCGRATRSLTRPPVSMSKAGVIEKGQRPWHFRSTPLGCGLSGERPRAHAVPAPTPS
jgi:hypothetical protein